MAKRIVKGTVVVKRPDDKKEGTFKRVVPTIGQPFDFTADEIKDFDRITPGVLAKVDAEDDPVDTAPSAPADSKADKPAPKKNAPAKDDEDL